MNTGSSSINLIYNIFKIITPGILLTKTDDELFQMGQLLHETYYDDISDQISNQLIQFRHCFPDKLKQVNSIKDVFDLIVIKSCSSSSSYSDIVTACFLFLTILVSVATAGRTFSKLKLIKNYLRKMTGRGRLSALAIISVENQIARNLEITCLINSFANQKVRKKNFI